MIVKNFEIKKLDFDVHNLFLFYGKNEGLKNETINTLAQNKNNVFNYEEKEILNNPNNFIENIQSQSFFEKEKLIIIKRATDKILQTINYISEKDLEGIIIIINSDILEKKSKLRSLFEKNKKFICVAFYPDTSQTLSRLTYEYLSEKKISISQSNINLIVNKSNGNRETLLNELKKIEFFCKNRKNITEEQISKLTSVIENYSISELVDNCLSKNKRKIISILNENNFSNEDCVLITRTFLNKSKKILKLSSEFEINKNIDFTISTAKPPIFWKDKDITKQQIYQWTPKKIKELIYRLGELELRIKKNINNSINLITDFIIEQSSSKTNN